MGKKLVFLLVILTLVLAACGGGGGQDGICSAFCRTSRGARRSGPR